MSYGSQNYRSSGFGGFSLLPPIIKQLLIINVIVFLIQSLFENIQFGGYPGWYILNRYFALNPLTGLDPTGQPFNFQIWQVISYQFMHGGFSHIFFNMFMLWMFGNEIENIMGSKKFLIFYLLSGIGAALVQVVLGPMLSNQLAFTIGASGAVFGVMIAFALFFPERQIYVYFLFPVKAKYLIAFLILIEFMAVGDMSFVAHLAHIGGALTAFIFIMLDKKNNFNIDGLFNKIKNSTPNLKNFSSGGSSSGFRKPTGGVHFGKKKIEDAEFYEINGDKKKTPYPTPQEIDKILDKISESGYQNLTDEEKRILFEASKKN
ncbi:MAG: rhomboid family intramembrane serine protease [Bacteroidetes bacterium]|nr:rhomboid family intramembrane serine protease [Bacteroidota bacterium]MBU1114579.1 rhomboid family intramembrane serine protease [Bacteroidota bacterium]MBU1799058.1 rhomboid family intramembrane serine protease [Bacteroidota bacterium]